ncbi:MAG: alpha/beta fold hydrolase [Chitinophagaceae bacterium]
MRNNTLQLADGRTLGYTTYGPENGKAVFYFHGTPSSRLELMLLNEYGVDLEQLLKQFNLQLIAIDRPGMGRSSFNSKGTFTSFASDAKELLCDLKVSNCPILCWSGGGRYALAMAHQYPDVIKTVFIICGFTRRFDKAVINQMGMNKWYFKTAKYSPVIFQLGMNILKRKQVTSPVSQRLTGLPQEDYVLLKNVNQVRMLMKFTLNEACKGGAKGAVYEARSYFNDFGFKIQDIQQPVHYWWGTKDNTVTQIHAEAIEKEAPNSILHYKEGEGHLSIYVHCMKEVLQTISFTMA